MKKEVPITVDNNNSQFDQQTLECITTTRSFWRYTSAILASFTYIGLILFPLVIESVIASQVSFENGETLVFVCGILQSIVAIYGGIKLGMAIYASCGNNCCCNSQSDTEITNSNKIWGEFWCGGITEFKSLLSGGYIICFLPQWFVTNAIISWVIVNHKVILPYYVHLMIYMPLLAYPTFIFIGCAIKKASGRSDYEQI
jgi:hypothetical protein